MNERIVDPNITERPATFKKSKRLEVGGRVLLIGAAAFTAVGADKSKGAESETFVPYETNTSEVKFSENSEISSSLLIALDPAGDEHPKWVDFIEVYMESDGVDATFRFQIGGDPTGYNTKLKTDTGYAIVFIDKETREGKFYAYAFGGQKTKDVGVQVREFSKAITGFDNIEINTIPNNGAKNDKIIYEAGEEAVTTKNGEVVFTIPQTEVDNILEGNDICVWTTEGTGHGNEVKKENGIQAFNKDHNCRFVPTETPEPTPTQTPKPTPTITPSPKPVPTAPATMIPPAVMSPEPAPKELPPTGGKGSSNRTDSMLPLGFALGGFAAMAAGLYEIKKIREREMKKVSILNAPSLVSSDKNARGGELK